MKISNSVPTTQQSQQSHIQPIGSSDHRPVKNRYHGINDKYIFPIFILEGKNTIQMR